MTISALQWNVPGMNAQSAPKWTIARPVKVAQPGVRRFAVCITLREVRPFCPDSLRASALLVLSLERGRECDFDRLEGLTDRATVLGLGGERLERRLVQTRGLDRRGEFDPADLVTGARSVQVHVRLGVDRLRRMARPGQREAQRHREA